MGCTNRSSTFLASVCRRGLASALANTACGLWRLAAGRRGHAARVIVRLKRCDSGWRGRRRWRQGRPCPVSGSRCTVGRCSHWATVTGRISHTPAGEARCCESDDPMTGRSHCQLLLPPASMCSPTLLPPNCQRCLFEVVNHVWGSSPTVKQHWAPVLHGVPGCPNVKQSCGAFCDHRAV